MILWGYLIIIERYLKQYNCLQKSKNKKQKTKTKQNKKQNSARNNQQNQSPNQPTDQPTTIFSAIFMLYNFHGSRARSWHLFNFSHLKRKFAFFNSRFYVPFLLCDLFVQESDRSSKDCYLQYYLYLLWLIIHIYVYIYIYVYILPKILLHSL